MNAWERADTLPISKSRIAVDDVGAISPRRDLESAKRMALAPQNVRTVTG